MTTATAPSSTSDHLLRRYAEARAESARLFAIVGRDFLYERPIPERHRIAFYIGHLEAFDWNLFRSNTASHSPELREFHPGLDQLFAFGIDPIGGGLPTDQPSDWPTLKEIDAYTGRIGVAIDQWLPAFLSGGETPSGVPASTIVEAAIEHRLMHAETLAYMVHQMPVSQKIRPAAAPASSQAGEAFSARQVLVGAGATLLGLPPKHGFGWDNEFDAHAVHVPGFSIGKYKVMNGEYLEFINAGGYRTPEHWDAADWDWKERNGITRPAFWTPAEDRWLYRTMFDTIPLPLDWPVYVSLAEASAFARWVGKQLPTEPQWQRAAFAYEASPQPAAGNLDFRRWDPIPAHSEGQSVSPFGAVGMTGNGWEWTQSAFLPFPGFSPYPFYPGYSANFFDGQHYVMKGASARTAACMARPSFRNWFQRHYQYMYAGFRCVDGQEGRP